MRTKEKIFAVLLLVIFIVIGIVEYNAPLPLNWDYSFSRFDKIPYGEYAVYDMLEDIFPGKKITSSDLSLYNSLDDSTINTNLIIINKTFAPDSLEADALLRFVSRGNTAFISAEEFWGDFADTLKINTRENYVPYSSNDSTGLNFTSDQLWRKGADYSYKKGNVDSYFSTCKGATVLSQNSKDSAVMLSIKFGNGTFLLSSVPMAFTNYYALKYPDNDYMFKALSYLPVADTRWDEHYKMVTHKPETPLRYILSNDSLKRAYYLMLLGLFIYIIFEAKRTQRIIPVVNPLQNTSLEFTETMGRLYFVKGTNKGIAEKRVRFLYDYIRSNYKINITEPDGDFYSALSAKTLISINELKELFTFILGVQREPLLDSLTLLKLNTLIEDFYKKTN